MRDSLDKNIEKIVRQIVNYLNDIHTTAVKLSDNAAVSNKSIEKILDGIDMSLKSLVGLQTEIEKIGLAGSVIESPEDPGSQLVEKSVKTPDRSRFWLLISLSMICLLILIGAGSIWWIIDTKNKEIATLRHEAEHMHVDLKNKIEYLEDSLNVVTSDVDSLKNVIKSVKKSKDDIDRNYSSLRSKWNSRIPVEIKSLRLFSGNKLVGTNSSANFRSVTPVVKVVGVANEKLTLTFKMIQISQKYKTSNRNGNTAGYYEATRTYTLKLGDNELRGPEFTSTASMYFDGECIVEVWRGDKCLETGKYNFK